MRTLCSKKSKVFKNANDKVVTDISSINYSFMYSYFKLLENMQATLIANVFTDLRNFIYSL